MGFLLRAGQVLLGAAVAAVAAPSCYSAGAGTSPPPSTFYFPVGLATSTDGTVLYAANSDFDLQWNGGTLQSYDLASLRTDAANLIRWNLNETNGVVPTFPFTPPPQGTCPGQPPDGGLPLGEGCSPPVDSQLYFKDSATIGAFATSAQLSVATFGGGHRRLFVPVRGDASLTWADIDPANPSAIQCGQGPDGRCDAAHHAGNTVDSEDTRAVTMPGEPFGMAQTEDGTAVAITQQTQTETSLLLTGGAAPLDGPSMQFVLSGVPTGGIGIVAVPHDPDDPILPPCVTVGGSPDGGSPDGGSPDGGATCLRPAFLETNRSVAEIDLLRYYDDDGSSLQIEGSSLRRPFLEREATFPITSNAIGTDSRGIVIDPTPRLACKNAPGADPQACAQLPARVFFASRTPPALGIGEIGGPPPTGAAYDPDRLVITGNVPLPAGPSNLYLAPIIDRTGSFALRVFVVCFDSNEIVVYDPDAGMIENVINVGLGPFAMTFDPYLTDALDQSRWSYVVPPANSVQSLPPPFNGYRFAYVASFTDSYVQMIDLDNSNAQPTAETFERVVFTLGQPTTPKGQ